MVILPRGVGGAPGNVVSCALRCGLSMSHHEVSLVRTHCHGAGGTPPETECAFHERLPAERLEREFQKQEGQSHALIPSCQDPIRALLSAKPETGVAETARSQDAT